MPFLAAAFWLVVTVHGQVRHQAGPLTAEACALQMAFAVLQMERIAAEGVPVVIDGRVVTLGDVKIECKPGERAS